MSSPLGSMSQPNVALVAVGKFDPAGANVVWTAQEGFNPTITRNAAGDYTVTLSDAAEKAFVLASVGGAGTEAAPGTVEALLSSTSTLTSIAVKVNKNSAGTGDYVDEGTVTLVVYRLLNA